MIKKILLLLFIFLLTGCYDHKELNTIAILTATEITKEKNEYIINAEVVNPQSPDKTITVQAPFIIYTGKGKTIQEAYRQIKLSSSRYLYPNHMQIIIINEKLAKEDITQILDFYLRNPAFRTEFKVLIGKNDNILNITTPIDIISSSSILESLETSNKYLGSTNLVTFNELTSTYLNPNTEIILPSIEAVNYDDKGDSKENTEKTKTNTSYKLNNLAIFKDKKLKGYLTQDESITYNLILNKTKNAIITYECQKDKYINLETIKTKSKITTKNKEININLEISGNINESTCNINYKNQKTMKQTETEISKYLENKIKKDIDNIRTKYNSDIFGFLDIIYKKDYNTYKNIKETWYKEDYKNIKINVSTKVNIIGIGNVSEGINEKN